MRSEPDSCRRITGSDKVGCLPAPPSSQANNWEGRGRTTYVDNIKADWQMPEFPEKLKRALRYSPALRKLGIDKYLPLGSYERQRFDEMCEDGRCDPALLFS